MKGRMWILLLGSQHEREQVYTIVASGQGQAALKDALQKAEPGRYLAVTYYRAKEVTVKLDTTPRRLLDAEDYDGQNA